MIANKTNSIKIIIGGKMKEVINEPNTWKKPNTHHIEVLKNSWYKQLVMLQNLITEETVNFYASQGIITMHLPVTTGTISSPMGRGSDSKPVKVNLEGTETYLADSMQFLLEYGCRLTDKGCYYVMPSFRGEKADERHLCQFYHSEAEIPGTLEDVMILVEKYIKYLSSKIIEKMGEQLIRTVGDISHLEIVANYTKKFKRITFDEAEKILKEKFPKTLNEYIEYQDGWRNITRKAEKVLIEIFDGIVWITNYDELAVPFYQKSDANIKGTAKNADLLMGIGETVGCGERHEKYGDLLEALKKHMVATSEYEWYIDMKKLFPLQTAGFGMGIERFLMWVLKANDIRNMQICLRFNGEKVVM